MSTIRNEISAVRSMNRLFSSDGQINDRTLAKELKDAALLLIKRETDKRKLFNSPNLFTPLPCLQMQRVPLAQCCDYVSPITISRSKEKLPKIAEGIYGLLIQSVSSLDNRVFFNEMTPERYANILKLELPKKEVYWLYDNYLYVTSAEIEAVNISCYPEEDVPTALLYPSGCKISTEDPCKNPLDQPFKCPGYLLSAVRDIVERNLMEKYFRLAADKSADGQDGQVINK